MPYSAISPKPSHARPARAGRQANRPTRSRRSARPKTEGRARPVSLKGWPGNRRDGGVFALVLSILLHTWKSSFVSDLLLLAVDCAWRPERGQLTVLLLVRRSTGAQPSAPLNPRAPASNAPLHLASPPLPRQRLQSPLDRLWPQRPPPALRRPRLLRVRAAKGRARAEARPGPVGRIRRAGHLYGFAFTAF